MGLSEKNRRANYYRLTAEGERELREGKRIWAGFCAGGRPGVEVSNRAGEDDLPRPGISYLLTVVTALVLPSALRPRAGQLTVPRTAFR
jgi:hypothetical protein